MTLRICAKKLIQLELNEITLNVPNYYTNCLRTYILHKILTNFSQIINKWIPTANTITTNQNIFYTHFWPRITQLKIKFHKSNSLKFSLKNATSQKKISKRCWSWKNSIDYKTLELFWSMITFMRTQSVEDNKKSGLKLFPSHKKKRESIEKKGFAK